MAALASCLFSIALASLPAHSTQPCELSATVETFSDVVARAIAGQSICLSSGNYGTWRGIDKSITLTKRADAWVSLDLDVSHITNGFTIDRLTVAGGRIAHAKNITIRNSQFTEPLIIDFVSDANILLDGNTHININTCATCIPAAIFLPSSGENFSGVTIRNSLFQGGNADGIQAGAGVNILSNRFIDISEHGADELHTDPIQLLGAKGSVVRGNYIYNCADGIVAYDGLNSATIEDNVIDLVTGRWGIEIYSDQNSVVRHNTLVYRTTCAFAPCGHIMLDRKLGDPPGQGTVIENNIATVISYANGSKPAVNRNNMVRQRGLDENFVGIPEFAGGDAASNYEEYALNKRPDGRNVGIRLPRIQN